jgi:hypothetical protein
MILVSVVIGLGLTEILTGAATLLRARKSVRFHWFHILFQTGVFFALLQQWWEFWDMEEMGEISYFAVLAILGPPVLLFLIANLLYPVSPEGVDLEEYYYDQAPLLWGLVIAGTVLGTFIQPLIFGEPVLHPANLSGIPMIVICGILAISKRRPVHAVLGPIIILMVLLDTVLANPAISAR